MLLQCCSYNDFFSLKRVSLIYLTNVKKKLKLYTDTPKSQRIKKNPPNKQVVVRNGLNDIDNVTRKKRRHDHGNRMGKHRQRHNRDAAKGDLHGQIINNNYYYINIEIRRIL